VQITASRLSGGRSLSQHSQFGLSFIIAHLPVLRLSSLCGCPRRCKAAKRAQMLASGRLLIFPAP
jgi:hypothetical protein